MKLRPLVTAIGIKLDQERIQSKHRAHQKHAAIAVLDVGRVHKGQQQQALGIYCNLALLAFDFLACIIARRVDRGPPFSALLTL